MSEKIKTLDGKSWDKDELLKNMMDDEFYYGYLAKYALSSSSIKKLSASPKKYLDSLSGEREDNPAFDFGSLFHWYVLEPDVYKEQVFVNVGKRGTKAWNEAKEEFGRVFLRKDGDVVEALAEPFLENDRVKELLSRSRFEIPEVGYINGYPFRAKADILGDGFIVDLKTCADIDNFSYDARKYGYSAQVYIYCTLFNIRYPNWRFLAVDKKTGEFDFFCVSEEFYEQGREIVDRATYHYRTYIDPATKTMDPDEFTRDIIL